MMLAEKIEAALSEREEWTAREMTICMLEAMRIPDQAMLDSVDRSFGQYKLEPADAWTCMIDAAIKETVTA